MGCQLLSNSVCWDSCGFLPTEELPWGLASGCNTDQVASDGGRGGKFRGGAVASGVRGTDPRFLYGFSLLALSSRTEQRGLRTGLMVLGQNRAYVWQHGAERGFP